MEWQAKIELRITPIMFDRRFSDYISEKEALNKVKEILKNLLELPVEKLKDHVILWIDPHSVEHDPDALW